MSSAYEILKHLRDRVVGRGPWQMMQELGPYAVVSGSIGEARLSVYPELIELIPDLLDEYEQLESANGYQDEMQEENAELHTEVQDLRDEIEGLEDELRDLKRYMAEEMRLASKRVDV